ncbi:MAG: hypothetical protein JNK15_06490 [Planctomycetes bacterium]|nr:hypothetical protein [Planctomycetota bacterium]
MSSAAQNQPSSILQLARILPASLLDLPLSRLPLGPELAATVAGLGWLTVGDALAASPGDAANLADEAAATLRTVLARVLNDGLCQFATTADDWPTLRAQLLGPLGDDERCWLADLVGIDKPPEQRPLLARATGISTAELDARAERLRATLAERAAGLCARLHQNVVADLDANDGVVMVAHAGQGSLLHVLAHATDDPELGLRFCAFLFGNEMHLHHGALYAMSPRRFRRLVRALPRLLPHTRLPLPVDTIAHELESLGHFVPRGALLQILRSELRIAIELDGERGEVAAADPRRPAARLAELLGQAGRPLPLADLVFAWRECYRSGSRSRLQRLLRTSDLFLQVGPDAWALRADHKAALEAVHDNAEKVARQLQTLGGRHHVSTLLGDGTDERTEWLVLDHLAHDPRVRLLGRGDACAATHRQSRVLEGLLAAFRKAAGEVVESLFLSNQPGSQRRLVQRLLRHNRRFVQPAPDRVDTLTNWPFNDERMQRLLALVDDHLRRRAGHATATALKVLVDQTDLGGDWLTPRLLADVLRRNGPFELLPGDIVARRELALATSVLRSARLALRDAGVPLSVDDVLRARPELAEFAPCLHELLAGDPLVQSPDGVTFQLA